MTSSDGTVWSQALDYDFAVEDDPGQWRLAELDFTLPEDASTLYIRFEALTGSVNRIDDVLLTAGEGGQEAIPGGETELELSTIAEVLAGPVDTKVIVSLSRAEFDNYNGLYEIKNGVVFKTGDVADEMIVPVISAAEAGQYLCQYVTVKDLTPAESATTWVVGGETTNTVFTDAAGDKVTARVTSYAEFADLTIEHVTADLSGVMQVYNGTYQLFPTSNGDVAGFTAE